MTYFLISLATHGAGIWFGGREAGPRELRDAVGDEGAEPTLPRLLRLSTPVFGKSWKKYKSLKNYIYCKK